MPAALRTLIALVSRPLVAGAIALVIGGAAVAWAYSSTSVAPQSATAPVVAGAITEEVDVPASVEAAQETSLAFQTSGSVAAINVKVGDHVAAGETLVTLASANQSAAVAGALATLHMKQAALASLEAGTRPEELAAAEAATAAAIRSAYVAADDAVHNRADLIFSNPASTPTLLYPHYAALRETVESERAALNATFIDWQAAIAGLSDENAAAVAATSETDLTAVETFLTNAGEAVNEALPSEADTATLSADASSIATGRVNVASAASALATAASSLSVAAAKATPEDIAAAQAGVDAAQAALTAAQAALGNTALVAPVSGTITVQSADPGETVIPGTPVVSMVADGKYQAVAQVSEADIAKIQTGEQAEATFDAYPGAVFAAHVTTVDPAATETNGVSAYGVTVTFDANDPRLSEGLSANLRIITAEKSGVLTVPASAVITDNGAAFVYVAGAGAPVKTPVTTGIQSADGMVEVVSGLSAGERVLTYGASAS